MNVPVKKGMLLRYEGHFYVVEEVVEHHSGKQRPVHHVSLRHALEGRHIERTLDQLMPLEPVEGAMRALQYLYHRGGRHVFMDSQSFEEIELGEGPLQGREMFLKEGEEYRCLFAGEQPLRLEVPEVVALRVSDTAAPSHAVGSAGSVLKEATLENGLLVRVPLFIGSGDVVRIDTRTKQYVGK